MKFNGVLKELKRSVRDLNVSRTALERHKHGRALMTQINLKES